MLLPRRGTHYHPCMNPVHHHAICAGKGESEGVLAHLAADDAGAEGLHGVREAGRDQAARRAEGPALHGHAWEPRAQLQRKERRNTRTQAMPCQYQLPALRGNTYATMSQQTIFLSLL